MSEADRNLFTICIDADKLKFDYSWLRSEDKLAVVEDALESLCKFLDNHLNGAAKKLRHDPFNLFE
ncbi:uncharacterized protein STEHIDRAFT_167886 [Stereum hirsutum FP-91666 SS1]|uniref:uncharacterized protein n=1 Tax=Stereum hirsutum (strain FP-91666) TaxID=721885 RepID=UPI000440D7F4|nr:uncharacterized protein STEHIDRAFT_167886 [Stereum hirsutum FP-91666 SS1]EIM86995.1 hypothetical protein STEHIDRAFT_167886 [Stereum hirsutum FP-91666 SS1]